MADTTALKNRIRAAIKANDNQEITGPVLQQALLDVVDELNEATETEVDVRQNGDNTLQQNITTEKNRAEGAESTLQQNITTEKNRAEGAESTLQQNITAEKNRAEEAESTLQQNLEQATSQLQTAIRNLRNAGYAFGGTAVFDTNPDIPSSNCFYIVCGAGTYTHFKNADNESIVLEDDGIYVFTYDSVENNYWEYNLIIGIDDEPTAESDNLVRSSGIYGCIQSSVGSFYFSIDGFIDNNGIIHDGSGWKHTPKIPVQEDEVFMYSGSMGAAYSSIIGYDSEDNILVILAGGNSYSSKLLTIPEGIVSIVAQSNSSVPHLLLNKHGVATSIVQNAQDVAQNTQDITRIKLEIEDSVSFSMDGFFANNGRFYDGSDWKHTPKIPVQEGEVFTYSGGMGAAYSSILGYDSEDNISVILAGGDYIYQEVTIPSGIVSIIAQSKSSEPYMLTINEDECISNKVNTLKASIQGYAFSEDGFFANNGRFYDRSDWKHTPKIPVQEGEVFIYSGGMGAAYSSIIGYDSEDNISVILAGGIDYTNQEVTIPSGIVSIIAQSRISTSYLLLLISTLFSALKIATATDLKNEYYGKTINWLGDSITAGNFDNKVAAYFGMTENDYGIGGSTIARNSNDSRNSMAVRYANMADNVDVVVVSGGTNDYQYSWTPFGSIGDNTVDTFYGALDVLCRGLIAKYPTAIIFFTTPLKRNQDNNGGDYTHYPYDTQQDIANSLGKTLKDYSDAIKQVCAKYSIPVCDLYSESMLNPNMSAQAGYFDNVGTHPNNTGTDIMARRVRGFMKQLC